MYKEIQKLQPGHIMKFSHDPFVKNLSFELLHLEPLHQSGPRRPAVQRVPHQAADRAGGDVAVMDKDDSHYRAQLQDGE